MNSEKKLGKDSNVTQLIIDDCIDKMNESLSRVCIKGGETVTDPLTLAHYARQENKFSA